MLYLKDIKEQERRNGDRLTFLQKKMKKLKRKNYQDNDFIKWLKQKYNDKDSGLFTHLYCQILLKIYLCGVNTLVLIYCARLVRRKRALIKQIKKSPQKYTEILLKADTQLPDEEMERFMHEAEESRKNAELEKKEIKNKKSTCIIVRDAIFEICNKIFLFTGIYLLACKIFNRDLKAATTLSGNIRVIATAGSGKTTAMAYRIMNLIKSGVEPSKIGCFTFTNAGAGEMKDRIKGFCDIAGLDVDIEQMVISTIHSFGDSLLKDYYYLLGYTKPPVLINEIQKTKIVEKILSENDPIDELIDRYKNFYLDMFKAKGILELMKGYFSAIQEGMSQDDLIIGITAKNGRRYL